MRLQLDGGGADGGASAAALAARVTELERLRRARSKATIEALSQRVWTCGEAPSCRRTELEAQAAKLRDGRGDRQQRRRLVPSLRAGHRRRRRLGGRCEQAQRGERGERWRRGGAVAASCRRRRSGGQAAQVASHWKAQHGKGAARRGERRRSKSLEAWPQTAVRLHGWW